MADGVGFEPTDACTSPVFKTGALNRSATHPSLPCQSAGRGFQDPPTSWPARRLAPARINRSATHPHEASTIQTKVVISLWRLQPKADTRTGLSFRERIV